MPFDESMFAEGQTMNMYWDQELRNRTKASFEPKIVAPVEAVEALPNGPSEPVVEMPVAADEELVVENIVVESLDDVKRDSQVYAKSTASTVTLWVIVGVAAAFLVIVLYLRTTKKLRF